MVTINTGNIGKRGNTTRSTGMSPQTEEERAVEVDKIMTPNPNTIQVEDFRLVTKELSIMPLGTERM